LLEAAGEAAPADVAQRSKTTAVSHWFVRFRLLFRPWRRPRFQPLTAPTRPNPAPTRLNPPRPASCPGSPPARPTFALSMLESPYFTFT